LKKLPEYIPLRLQPQDISAAVYLKCGGQLIDVSNSHGIFCHEPFIIAMWSEHNLDASSAKLIIQSSKKRRVSASLQPLQKINAGKQVIYLFKILRTEESFTDAIMLKYLSLKIKPSQGYRLYKLYAALYAFPRKIIVTSFSSADHRNCFPMDFQGFINNENIILLGLRNTNITLQHILQYRQFAIADADANSIKPVYNLGKHHSSKPIDVSVLPGVHHTKNLNIPFPAFTQNFKELLLINSIDLGSHTILISKVTDQSIPGSLYNLYHVSQFEFRSNKQLREFVID